MADWTPWEKVGLVAVLAVLALGGAALAVWYTLATRARESADLSPDERTARRLAEALGRCGVLLKVETTDEVLAIFARATAEQRRVLAAALSGLLASLGEPVLVPDLNGRVLALVRRLGDAERPATDDRPN